MQYNTIQHCLFPTKNKNIITTTICSQNWDDWKGGGQKNNLIVVHPQHSGMAWVGRIKTFTIFCSRVLYLTCYLQLSPSYLFLNRMAQNYAHITCVLYTSGGATSHVPWTSFYRSSQPNRSRRVGLRVRCRNRAKPGNPTSFK